MDGLQGASPPSRVNVPSATAATNMVSTAIGRRFQLFSPSPARKGSASSAAIVTAGPIRRIGVSADGGNSESSAKSQRKKKSGRGAVSMMVGSGVPLGPNGPRTAAQMPIANTIAPENMMSFQTAYGTNGTPSRCVL